MRSDFYKGGKSICDRFIQMLHCSIKMCPFAFLQLVLNNRVGMIADYYFNKSSTEIQNRDNIYIGFILSLIHSFIPQGLW